MTDLASQRALTRSAPHLPLAWYFDPKVAEIEQKLLFAQGPGYVGHVHYDQASVLRTMELILGVTPLSAYDAGATPLYDLFQTKDSAAQLTAADLRPFDVAKAPPFIDETVASLPKTSKNASLTAFSRGLDLVHVDKDQAGIEAVLWQSVRDDPLPTELRDDMSHPPL